MALVYPFSKLVFGEAAIFYTYKLLSCFLFLKNSYEIMDFQIIYMSQSVADTVLVLLLKLSYLCPMGSFTDLLYEFLLK